MFKEVTGDLFEGGYQAIGHGVNCRGVMGAGIATVFRDKFPIMYEEYKLRCDYGYLRLGEVFAHYAGGGRWVYNIASQFNPGAEADLSALGMGVGRALAHAKAFGVRELALPQIGCGIGGLSYSDVRTRLMFEASIQPTVELIVVILDTAAPVV